MSTRYKIFAIPYLQNQGEFDDKEFQKFIKGHDIMAVEKKFFRCDGQVGWTVFVTYEESATEPGEHKDAIASLSKADQDIYQALRTWRNEKAQEMTQPPYVLFSNQQLLDITLQKPLTKAALEQIPGIGQAKTEKYGEMVLKILENALQKKENS